MDNTWYLVLQISIAWDYVPKHLRYLVEMIEPHEEWSQEYTLSITWMQRYPNKTLNCSCWLLIWFEMNILLNKKFKRIEPEAVVLIEGSPLPKYTICIPILARVNIQLRSSVQQKISSHKISLLWRARHTATGARKRHIATGAELQPQAQWQPQCHRGRAACSWTWCIKLMMVTVNDHWSRFKIRTNDRRW